MGLTVAYSVNPRGNTIPYKTVFDEIRRNWGFVDLRGRPELVGQLEEASRSVGLRGLLQDLAQPSSSIISLGCDLGEHSERGRPFKTRRTAGGYVQIADAAPGRLSPSELQSLARLIEEGLKVEVGGDFWEVRFELQPVVFELGERVEAYSIWIWFFASASTRERAMQSRERLLTSLGRNITATAENLQSGR